MTGLRDPLLESRAARHGFALADSQEPPGLARPRQVHGVAVVRAGRWRAGREAPEADAVVSTTAGLGVGVVTADCVPLLLTTRDGRSAAAVHAGWRGLAQGVVEAGVEALAEAAGVATAELVAAIGPHAGPCCYEVDAPVLDALAERHAAALERATRPARPGHVWLDLGELARSALLHGGVPAAQVGRATVACTCCDPRRFASYRRDGPRSGRLVHFIVPV